MTSAVGRATTRHHAIARQLYDAERAVAPVPPLSSGALELGIADAYCIQILGRGLRLADGHRLVGHKVGLTSAAMQEMLGVDQPDFGYLLDHMVHSSGARIPAHQLIEPRVEGEIAFRLSERLAGPNVTRSDVLAATDAVAPAIEVIDSRILDWRIRIEDTVADNASCGCVVLGTWRPVDDLDLAALDGVIRVTAPDGSAESSAGSGSAVLGHPAEAVAWLAHALEEYGGEALEAGHVVLPGAVSRALPIACGQRVHVSFSELGEVDATLRGGST